VFDALRTAQGLTPYSNLQSVTVTRKLPDGAGGGKVRTALNFLDVITSGNEDQNIRLSDGDVITVAKSSEIMRDQLLKAGQTNLSPQFLQVFVSGRGEGPRPADSPPGINAEPGDHQCRRTKIGTRQSGVHTFHPIGRGGSPPFRV
jgi:polysaccharide export outer membrane protein